MSNATSQTVRGGVLAAAALGIAASLGLLHLGGSRRAVAFAEDEETGRKQSEHDADAMAELRTFAELSSLDPLEDVDPATVDPLEATRDAEPDAEPPTFIWRNDPPVAADWFTTLPEGESFRLISVDAKVRASAGNVLSLTWQLTDRGPAVLDDAGTIDSEGHHDRQPELVVGWQGRVATVTLDDSWDELESSSYCARKKEPAPKPRTRGVALSSFVLANFRGETSYEVYLGPRSLVVIQDDTTPLDWIPSCEEIRQGPYVTCRETQWVRYAEIDLEVPLDVPLREDVRAREKNGPWHGISCE